MNVLTITWGMGLGGVERTACRFASAYQQHGYSSAVLNLGEDGPRQFDLTANGIPVWGGTNGLDAGLRQAIRFKPDLVHIHRSGWYHPVETKVLMALREQGAKVVEKNVFGGVDRVSPYGMIDVHYHLSDWCLWRWMRWRRGRGRGEPCVVLPNPTDSVAFYRETEPNVARYKAERGLDGAHYLCGRVGQPIMGKWHPWNILGFVPVAQADPTAMLVLVGLPPGLTPMIDRLPAAIRARIVCLPMIRDDAQLRCLYSSLDCFLHVAQQGESFGNVLYEAMLCECPVITASRPHRDNSQIHLAIPGSGVWVAGRARQTGPLMLRLLQNPALRRAMGCDARRYVLNHFAGESVYATACRVGELVVQSANEDELRRNLAAQDGIVTAVTSAQMRRCLHATKGPVSGLDLLRMEWEHLPPVHQLKNTLRRIRTQQLRPGVFHPTGCRKEAKG